MRYSKYCCRHRGVSVDSNLSASDKIITQTIIHTTIQRANDVEVYVNDMLVMSGTSLIRHHVC